MNNIYKHKYRPFQSDLNKINNDLEDMKRKLSLMVPYSGWNVIAGSRSFKDEFELDIAGVLEYVEQAIATIENKWGDLA